MIKNKLIADTCLPCRCFSFRKEAELIADSADEDEAHSGQPTANSVDEADLSVFARHEAIHFKFIIKKSAEWRTLFF
ncbi:MAG: hypothetical protein PHX25_00530 [Candidatus Pacebacteria bacterium]|nr:hypothetical protein [Candidatus Paceibacterota bacterium]